MNRNLFFLLAGILLAGCNPDNNNNNSSDPYAGQYVRCNVNGVPWEATDDSIAAAYTNSGYPVAGMVGGYTSTGITMHIFIEYPLAADTTVNVSTTGTHSVVRYYTPTGIYGCDNGQATIHKGPSNIQYISEIWTGTFSGTFIKLLVSTPDTIQITNGEFEAHVY